MLRFDHKGPEHLRIAVLAVDGIRSTAKIDKLETDLAALLETRLSGLTPELDTWRQAVRDVFRNGTYKPTGRGKPASEYLLRAAREGAFPRINALVDINNYISLSSLLPASLWDVGLAGTDAYTVRLGQDGESYVFNTSGQTIELKDLIVGCAVEVGYQDGRPIVNPVKDCMATKTSESTRSVGAIVYAPATDGPEETLESVCRRFEELLTRCSEGSSARGAILRSGQSIQI